jgi:fucose 4-O-acetylase-like acetyltransferase
VLLLLVVYGGTLDIKEILAIMDTFITKTTNFRELPNSYLTHLKDALMCWQYVRMLSEAEISLDDFELLGDSSFYVIHNHLNIKRNLTLMDNVVKALHKMLAIPDYIFVMITAFGNDTSAENIFCTRYEALLKKYREKQIDIAVMEYRNAVAKLRTVMGINLDELEEKCQK